MCATSGAAAVHKTSHACDGALTSAECTRAASARRAHHRRDGKRSLAATDMGGEHWIAQLDLG